MAGKSFGLEINLSEPELLLAIPKSVSKLFRTNPKDFKSCLMQIG